MRTVVTMLGFTGSLLAVSPVMAAVVLVSAVPVVAAELSLSARRSRLMWTVSPHERRQVFYSQLMIDRTAAKEIRLFGLAGFVRSRMLHELRQVNAAQRRLDRRVCHTQFALAALTATVAGVGLVWGILQARAGLLTPGDVIVFIAAVAGVQTGLSGLVSQLASGHQALLQFAHYLAVLNAEPDLPAPALPTAALPLQSAIELRDVWFRYDPDKPWVLRGVSLRIPAGSLLALVGVNGAGKSTLVKLLCRLYEPTRGSITWDGADIRHIPVADLRERIGTVFQDHMNYDFTAADNIGIGDLPALHDRDRIRTAATAAEVDATVTALPPRLRHPAEPHVLHERRLRRRHHGRDPVRRPVAAHRPRPRPHARPPRPAHPRRTQLRPGRRGRAHHPPPPGRTPPRHHQRHHHPPPQWGPHGRPHRRPRRRPHHRTRHA
ncbi:hypothetical protein GCM10020001_115540 [Nonomuraea salmonea]